MAQHEFEAGSAWVSEIAILLVVALDCTDCPLPVSHEILGRGARFANALEFVMHYSSLTREKSGRVGVLEGSVKF